MRDAKNKFGAAGLPLLGFILALLLLAPATLPALDMVIEDDHLSIKAEGVPLSQVLRRFTESGVRVRISPGIRHEVTARFEGRPIAAGLAAILRPLNHSLVWETVQTPLGPVNRLAEIAIFRAGEFRPAPVAAAPRPVLPIHTDPKTGARYVAHQLLLAFDETMDAATFKALLARIGGRLIDVDPVLGIYRIAVSGDEDIPDLCRRLVRESGVAAAEPNYAFRMQPALPWTAPRSVADSMPAGISLSEDVAPVAVLDSGWRTDPAYANVVVAAYDALAPDTPMDDTVGHGTQMALIASGRIRPSGMERQTTISDVPVVAVRIFDESGYTASSVLMRGIDFALEAGARVISLSWGAETPSTFIERAVHMARDHGAVVVAAVGNDNTGQPVYPAAFEGVVGVGALNPDGTVWPRSNQGDFVALLAPGFASLPVGSQGEPPGAYAGTSIAAAYTAGRLAWGMSRNPAAAPSEDMEKLFQSK
jgi:subtilisin family serine protease